MSREQLFDAMVHLRSVAHAGYWWKIQTIQLEDGSGFCFNVTLARESGHSKTVFVRCQRPAPLKIA